MPSIADSATGAQSRCRSAKASGRSRPAATTAPKRAKNARCRRGRLRRTGAAGGRARARARRAVRRRCPGRTAPGTAATATAAVPRPDLVAVEREHQAHDDGGRRERRGGPDESASRDRLRSLLGGARRAPGPPARVGERVDQQDRDEPHRSRVEERLGVHEHRPVRRRLAPPSDGRRRRRRARSRTPSRTSRSRANRRGPLRSSEPGVTSPDIRKNSPIAKSVAGSTRLPSTSSVTGARRTSAAGSYAHAPSHELYPTIPCTAMKAATSAALKVVQVGRALTRRRARWSDGRLLDDCLHRSSFHARVRTDRPPVPRVHNRR